METPDTLIQGQRFFQRHGLTEWLEPFDGVDAAFHEPEKLPAGLPVDDEWPPMLLDGDEPLAVLVGVPPPTFPPRPCDWF
jgi:hypothetical protein